MNQNHTNASIAERALGTPRTKSSAIVTPAGSTIQERIDSFIKRNLEAAGSVDFSAIESSALRAGALGFKSSANSRYAAWLEAFRSTPALAAKYAESYPACVFLPWTAFHAVKKTLGLWCDLPEFYAGAVPDEQLPWMEIFELDPVDALLPEDLSGLVGEGDRLANILMAVAHNTGERAFGKFNPRYGDYTGTPDELVYWFEKVGGGTYGVVLSTTQMGALRDERFVRPIEGALAQAEHSFFVMAPPDAFTTDKEWIERVRTRSEAFPAPTVAPPDPLVIRFCHGGALVVAVWGDEGAALHEITKELGI